MPSPSQTPTWQRHRCWMHPLPPTRPSIRRNWRNNGCSRKRNTPANNREPLREYGRGLKPDSNAFLGLKVQSRDLQHGWYYAVSDARLSFDSVIVLGLELSGVIESPYYGARAL